jgi:hypothetical protein
MTIAYARPTLVRCGSAVASTRGVSTGSTFDNGTVPNTKKSETKSMGILSAQVTDAGSTTGNLT